MKKLALATGGLVAANVVANIGINKIATTGGIGRLVFVVTPYLIPAPINYYLMVNGDTA